MGEALVSLRPKRSTKDDLCPIRISVFILLIGLGIAALPACALLTQNTPFSGPEYLNLPRSATLCDEHIPIENPGIWEKLDREFTIAVYDRPQVVLWLKRAGRYFPHIEKKLAEQGLPDDLKYLAVVESALITSIRSNKGAAGMWQLMSRTARQLGLRKSRMIDERLDYERSTAAALSYLKYLRNTFDNWTLVLAAYNCGEGLLKSEMRKQKVDDFYSLNLPAETERFIFRIAAAKIIMENANRYGYHLEKDQIYKPLQYDTVEVKIRRQIHLSNVADSLGSEYRVLKLLNPHILKHRLPIGRYAIKVPPGSGPTLAAVLHQFDSKSSGKLAEISPNHYVVKSGDTLSHIAARTGVPVPTLRRLNNIRGSLLRIGQTLQLAP